MSFEYEPTLEELAPHIQDYIICLMLNAQGNKKESKQYEEKYFDYIRSLDENDTVQGAIKMRLFTLWFEYHKKMAHIHDNKEKTNS